MTYGGPHSTGKVMPVDGIHDLGGMQGFGAVAHSAAEPAFPDRWQATARALMEAVAGAVEASGGEFRHSIERMDPGHYLTSSYYEHWLTGAATLAVEHGLVTHAELEARAGGRFPLSGPALAPPVADTGPDIGEPRFGVGDRVRVRDWHPPGHTRCPRYVRGKAGTDHVPAALRGALPPLADRGAVGVVVERRREIESLADAVAQRKVPPAEVWSDDDEALLAI